MKIFFPCEKYYFNYGLSGVYGQYKYRQLKFVVLGTTWNSGSHVVLTGYVVRILASHCQTAGPDPWASEG